MSIIRKRRYSWLTQSDQSQLLDLISKTAQAKNASFGIKTDDTKIRFFVKPNGPSLGREGVRYTNTGYLLSKKQAFVEWSALAPVFCAEIRKNELGTEVNGRFVRTPVYRVVTGILWTAITFISIICLLTFLQDLPAIPGANIEISGDIRGLLILMPFLWYLCLSINYVAIWLLQKKRRMNVLNLIGQAVGCEH